MEVIMEKVLDETQNPVEVKEEIQQPKEQAENQNQRESIEEMLKGSEDLIEADDNEEVVEEVEKVDVDEDETEESETDDSEDEPSLSLAEELVEEHVKKDGKQKRIDKLTAVNSELKAEIDAIKAQLSQDKPKVKQETNYTDEQLKVALQKAINEGDADLQWEIMSEMRTQAERSAITKLQQRELQAKQQQEQVAREIAMARDQYSYLADDSIPEIYNGSHNDLDVNNPESLLNKTAEYLYRHKDYAQRYHVVGGIAVCVNDALKIIINNKKGLKPKDKEKETLKNKVKKAGRKTSVKSNSVKSDTKTIKPKSRQDSFEEEMARRKKIANGERV